MKRGLVEWDREELPEGAFAARLAACRAAMCEERLDALLVYTDVWRSGHVRYLSHYLPYWSSGLLALPVEGEPLLLSTQPQRVFPWIAETSLLREVRAAPALGKAAAALLAERDWRRAGVVELHELPWGIYVELTAGAPRECELVDASALMRDVRQSEDTHEEALLTKAAAMAAAPLAALEPAGQRDWSVVAMLERAYRRAGAEDLMLLATSPTAGQWPGLPREAVLADGALLHISLEYKGHWVQISRTWPPVDGASPLRALHERLERAYAELSETARPGLSAAETAALLKRLAPGDGLHLFAAHASGSAPFTPLPGLEGIEEGMVVALHLGAEDRQGRRALVGDTFMARREGLARVTT